MSFGLTSGGWYTDEYYRPSIQEFPDLVCSARDNKLNPSCKVPIPAGWDFDLVNKSLLIEPDYEAYSRFKKAFGYVANIHDTFSDDTASPVQLTIVLKLPFKYGTKACEKYHSWAFGRIQAFGAKAAFPRHFEAISIGDAVTGVICVTGGDYRTAHLGSWKACSFDEWWKASPRSFFDEDYRSGLFPPPDSFSSPNYFFSYIPPFFGFHFSFLWHRIAHRRDLQASRHGLSKFADP